MQRNETQHKARYHGLPCAGSDRIQPVRFQLHRFPCPELTSSVATYIFIDKARQDKTRQDKRRQDNTRQDKTRQGKTRYDKT